MKFVPNTLSAAILVCYFVAIDMVNADLVKMCLYYKAAGHVRTDPILVSKRKRLM